MQLLGVYHARHILDRAFERHESPQHGLANPANDEVLMYLAIEQHLIPAQGFVQLFHLPICFLMAASPVSDTVIL